MCVQAHMAQTQMWAQRAQLPSWPGDDSGQGLGQKALSCAVAALLLWQVSLREVPAALPSCVHVACPRCASPLAPGWSPCAPPTAGGLPLG